ncbi:MAG: DNA mismatch repair protein MutS [Myxococcales bacterium]|nr:DNA mismatch repair protein MutS [Myxococcales bacterium]
MMQQWHEAKRSHPDCLLFFRMGDFYELFDDDAVQAARALELTLTSRDKDKENGQPMCGVPHHAAPGYLQRLLELGFKVAVCDQIEDPKQAKGIVKRAVTRVVTPGTVLEDAALDPRTSSFLAAIWPGLGGYGLVYADITTGEHRGTVCRDLAALASTLTRIEAREALIPHDVEAGVATVLARTNTVATRLPLDAFERTDGGSPPPKTRGVQLPDELRRAEAALASYIRSIRPRGEVALSELVVHDDAAHLVIDETSFRNLEIVKTIVGGRRSGSLFGLIDRTATAMGGRQLRRWLELPSRDRQVLEARLDAVGELARDGAFRVDVHDHLGRMFDLERLAGRLVAGVASPKDLAALRRSIAQLQPLRSRIVAAASLRLRDLGEQVDPLDDVLADLSATLADDPAASADEGRLIREGFDAEVDELTNLARAGKDWIAEYQAKERTRSGISSLKVSFNRVFGYYIEVSRTNLELVPKDYIRKQTVSTGERFYTLELKEYETKVLTAEDQRIARETAVFDSLRSRLRERSSRILRTASRVADIDVLTGLAVLAHEKGYVRPTLHDDGRLILRGSRHPVVEAVLPAGEFVPNDIDLHTDSRRVVLITGPNMAGKSTIMRQVALTVLLAQVGSYVPAVSAEIGLCDRIFTRVGASDDLSRGQSTFMVEMSETSAILRQATERSLVVLDEIGRGTSTFDGLSIAWAVAEHLNDVIKARTLFATHYHELTELARDRDTVKNVHVAVREWNDQIVFLRQLREGATNRSYGIQVGRLAGLPEAVVARAREVLARLEETDIKEHSVASPPSPAGKPEQLGLFGGPPKAAAPATGPSEVELQLARFDLNRSTPLEAMRLIERLQKRLSARSAP